MCLFVANLPVKTNSYSQTLASIQFKLQVSFTGKVKI
jgi:hypothetical protein